MWRPKQKANDILNDMAWTCRDIANHRTVAKQCARIAVKEIINQCEFDEACCDAVQVNPNLKYWCEVRDYLKEM